MGGSPGAEPTAGPAEDCRSGCLISDPDRNGDNRYEEIGSDKGQRIGRLKRVG
jgi:hypothetical protein